MAVFLLPDEDMKAFLQDLRYALRLQFKDARATIVIVAILGVGIGSLTTVFSVVNSTLLRPLAYHAPHELFRLFETNLSQGLEYFSVSPGNWLDWRKSESFLDLGAFVRERDYNLSTVEEPRQISATRVSANLFSIFGARPLLGRMFSTSADFEGSENAVILSYRLWNSQFGKDPEILGKQIYLNQEAFTVTGVMNEDFRLPINDGEVYLPLSLVKEEMRDRGGHFLRVFGRLKPGISRNQALQEMKQLSAALEHQYPESNKGWSLTMMSLEDLVIPERFRNASWILLAAALLVFMISCLNAANLLTAKGISRHREISIRRAIGATTNRLLLQLMTESLLLALISGAVGILLAVWGVEILHILEPENIPRLSEIRVDPAVMVFAVGASFLTVLFFGTISAKQSLGQDLQEGLKESSHAASAGTRRKNIRNFLVIVEAALSVVLLICAGLLMKSFMNLQEVELGFNPESLLVMKITAPEEKYSDDDQLRSAHRTLLERIRTTPGVEDAALGSLIPMGPGNSMTEFSSEGPPGPNVKNVYAASYRVVSPSYFRTMKIRMIRGRYFNEKQPAKTLIIDEFAVRQFWPDRDPIGQRIYLSDFDGAHEIIGIVNRVKSRSIDEKPHPIFYFSMLEFEPQPYSYLIARVLRNSTGTTEAIRKSIREIGPDFVIGRVSPLTEVVADSLTQRRFNMIILGIFASVALLLASVGLYSVVSYSVSQRRHEIGIRMALGARPFDVVRMIVKEGFFMAVLGLAAGIVLSISSTRLLISLLYYVDPADMFVFYFCSIFFLVIGFCASYIPARRAAGFDPVQSLRNE